MVKGRRLHKDRKHVNQTLRQFVSDADAETDYATMNLPSRERVTNRSRENEGDNHAKKKKSNPLLRSR